MTRVTPAARRPQRAPRPNQWQQELNAFVRAASGAFLFATPLLFTMEMWWLGTYAKVWRLGVFLGIGLAANVALSYVAGFKRETSLSTALDEAVDALAVGIVASLSVLLVLNRVSVTDPLDSLLGKVVLQAVPLSLGASVANIVFARGESRQGGADSSGRRDGGPDQRARIPDPVRLFLSDIGATVTGGVFLGFTIAPTEEIPMLAAGLTFSHQLALIALTLGITYGIVFASGFDPQQVGGNPRGPFQSPLTETVLAYLVSLGVSLGTLYLFGHAEAGAPLGKVLGMTLVLGMPTAIGGAAGRLVI